MNKTITSGIVGIALGAGSMALGGFAQATDSIKQISPSQIEVTKQVVQKVNLDFEKNRYEKIKASCDAQLSAIEQNFQSYSDSGATVPSLLIDTTPINITK